MPVIAKRGRGRPRREKKPPNRYIEESELELEKKSPSSRNSGGSSRNSGESSRRSPRLLKNNTPKRSVEKPSFSKPLKKKAGKRKSSEGSSGVLFKRRVGERLVSFKSVGSQTVEGPVVCSCDCRHLKMRNIRGKTKDKDLDLHQTACPLCATHFKVIVKPKLVVESLPDLAPILNAEEIISDDFLSFLNNENGAAFDLTSLPDTVVSAGPVVEDDGLPVVTAVPDDNTVDRGEPEVGTELVTVRRTLRKEDLSPTLAKTLTGNQVAFDYGVE